MLQVAIDDPSLHRAEEALDLLLEESVDLIEAGTPVLTTHGVAAIERFATRVPRNRIYADLKCMDLARDQVMPYLDRGVQHICVHVGLETVQVDRLIKDGTPYNAIFHVSTLGFPDEALTHRVGVLRSQGLLHFILHGEGLDPAEALRRALSKEMIARTMPGVRRTIAGGICASNCRNIPLDGVDGIIVGRGVVQAVDPRLAIRELRAWIKQ